MRAEQLLAELEEAREALALHRLGDVVGELRAGVYGRTEYLKPKRPLKPTSRDERQRRLEVLVGLAGEADDDVGREREARRGTASRARARATYSSRV